MVNTWSVAKCLAWATLATLGATGSLAGQGVNSESFMTHVMGEWRGEGVYDGNRLSLTRAWTSELGGAFLKADMQVSMPNGATFGALMYWKTDGEGQYDVVWMDGTGRSQSLRVLEDRDSGVLSTLFLDEFTEEGSQWRRWEFEPRGPDSYVERLWAQVGPEWERLAEFEFDRVGARP